MLRVSQVGGRGGGGPLLGTAAQIWVFEPSLSEVGLSPSIFYFIIIFFTFPKDVAIQ